MDKYEQAIKLHKKSAEECEQKRSDLIRITVEALISKDITTMSIGTIAELELVFGHLWGHGKPKSKLTADELEWRAQWELIREFILNGLHKNLRKIDRELDKLDFTMKRYTYTGIKK